MSLVVNLKKIKDEVITPKYQTVGSSGADLHAFIENDRIEILPQQTVVIDTGLYIELPKGYEAQVRSRGGLSTKGIFVTNSPGTIDEDYRGEIKIIMTNSSNLPFTVNNGDRIAQLVISPYVQAVFAFPNREFTETARGEGRFGHTGTT